MRCAKCGKDNSADLKLCGQCGAQLGGQVDAPVSPAPFSEQDILATMDAPRVEMGREIREGEVLAGQYRVVGAKPLGAGGMGEVWRGEDTELGTPVAIKVLPPMLARNEIAVANLRKEAMMGRQLTHHNICRLHSFHSDGAIKFIVMEFVDGKTLQQMLMDRDDHRLPYNELVPIARQLAEALDYAHNVTYSDSAGRQVRGVLHRDIKPGNIMVTADGTAKLMDFGIAREMHDVLTEVTGRTSQTPLYASPEQFCGKPVTAVSDLYSLANVFYECLAGHRLVSPQGDLAWQIINRPCEPLPDVPAHANAALAAALAKDPQARQRTAREFVQQLAGERTAATVPASAPAAPAAAPGRVRLWMIAAAVAVLVIGAVAVVLATRDGDSKPSGANGPVVANAGGAGTISPTPSPAADATPGPGQTPAATASPTAAATPSPAVDTQAKEFTNSIGMKFVRIPAGKFTMGSPRDEAGRDREDLEAAEKVIAAPFYLGACEVTQAQWLAVMGDSPSSFKGDENLPVESISWHKAVEFCDKLSAREGRTYRLPHEDEWEYACRAGTSMPYATGAALSTDQANYDGTYGATTQTAGANRNKTTPVGAFAPNAWGLYDMHGNVWEWCFDNVAIAKVVYVIKRGGAWSSKATSCRSASRDKDKPAVASKHVGLRVLMEIGKQ